MLTLRRIAAAAERVSKGCGSAADDLLIATSIHVYGERWTGWQWWECIYKTREQWKPAFLAARAANVPFILLHQIIFNDAFPAYLKHWKSFILVGATLGEFEHHQLSSTNSPCLLPVAIIDKEELQHPQTGFNFKRLGEMFQQELSEWVSGKVVQMCCHGVHVGPAVVVMLNSGIAGDAPGRCEICGFLTSGFCPYCGCEVNSFIIFFVAVKLF